MNGRMSAIALLTVTLASSLIVASASRLGAGEAEKPPVTSIAIDNFSFTPREVTVKEGSTITWVNHDDVPHTVVSKDQKFRSKALDTNDQFSFTFTNAGTYVYFCSVHPIMVGKVIVK